jgi:S1-C subfamily serine protease
MVDLTASMRRQFGIPDDVEGSVLVTQVDPDSSAYDAGLREGSIIIGAQHGDVSSVDEVLEAAGQTETGRLLLRVRNPGGGVSYLVMTVEK